MSKLDTRPPIKSAWPTPIGKPLTNRKIAKYQKQGYYATNNLITRAAAQTSKTSERRMSALLSNLA